MKIQGQQLPGLKATEVEFAGQKITIRALPLTFTNRLAEILPAPVPPHEFARDRKGNLVQARDGGAVAFYNERDPKYLAACSRHADLRGAAMIHEASKADESVTWEAQESAFKTPKEFYEAIYKELCDAGVTLGQMVRLGNAINVLTELMPDEIGEARTDFS